MGATNHTTNYTLSQFIGTDKPSWLNDYNGDMSAIDTAIHNVSDTATAASNAASSAASSATSAVNSVAALNTQINAPSTGLAAVVSDMSTDVSNLKTQAGSVSLTTEAQTLSGAVVELDGEIGDDVLTTTAQTLTGAVNEINAVVSGAGVSVTGEVGETKTALLDRLFALLTFDNIKSNAYLVRDTGSSKTTYRLSFIGSNYIRLSFLSMGSSEMSIYEIRMQSSASTFRSGDIKTDGTNNTISDGSTGSAAGETFTFYYF